MQSIVRSFKLLEHSTASSQGFKLLLASTEISCSRTFLCSQQQQLRSYAQQRSVPKVPQGAYQSPTDVARPSNVRVPMIASNVLAEPYKGVPPPLPLTAWFTPSGWKSRWHRWLGSFKSVYCLSKVKKNIPGWTLPGFKEEALNVYQEACAALAAGDKTLLRQLLAPAVFSDMKKQIRVREEGGWSRVRWEMSTVPALNQIEVVQGRLIAIDPKDDSTGFAQLTVRFKSGQKFAAFNSKGSLVAGNPEAETIVDDFWVFERPLKKQVANRWRVAGILSIPPP